MRWRPRVFVAPTVEGWGVAFIAVLGIGATLLAYWAVLRYVGRRLPQRRVRRGQCPFCGFPAGGGPHCEGCRRVIVVSALDNLGKGAAGNAIQNVNVALGLDETAGLRLAGVPV